MIASIHGCHHHSLAVSLHVIEASISIYIGWVDTCHSDMDHGVSLPHNYDVTRITFR